MLGQPRNSESFQACNGPHVNLSGGVRMHAMSLIECGGVECVDERVWVYEFQFFRSVNCDQFNNNLGTECKSVLYVFSLIKVLCFWKARNS